MCRQSFPKLEMNEESGSLCSKSRERQEGHGGVGVFGEILDIHWGSVEGVFVGRQLGLSQKIWTRDRISGFRGARKDLSY